MHFIAGLIMLWVGYRLWKKVDHELFNGPIPPPAISGRTPEQKDMRDLHIDVALAALNRETRAKNALIQVLRKQDCTEDEIEQVLAAIDSEEE